MPERTRIDIDLGRIERNAKTLRAAVGGDAATPAPKLCAVVKKEAYGLGAVQVAHRLLRAGASMLCVYGPEEAEALVKGAITAPILVLMPVWELKRTDLLYRPAVAETLHLAVHDPQQIDTLNGVGHTFGIRLPVHLYLDTGMSRSGLSREQFDAAVARIAAGGRGAYLRLAGVYTHFATADSDPAFLDAQRQRFCEAVDAHRGTLPGDVIVHAANTFATLRGPAYHFDMVRPGLGLFGYGPGVMADPPAGGLPTLEHAVRWVSRVIHVQAYPQSSPVGYGSTARVERRSLLGVIPVGYADGYPVALGNKGVVRLARTDRSGEPAWWDKKRIVDAPVLGRVNMDQIVVDLTDACAAFGLPIDGQDDRTRELVGAEVELISGDAEAANTVPKLAALADTNAYEILCRLHPNIPRRYV